MCFQGNTIDFAKADLAGIRTCLSVPSRALQKTSAGRRLGSLRLRAKPEACEGFKLLARMSGASKALDVAARGRSRSPRHEAKHIGETTLLPMHLSRGLYDIISTCSATVGRSTNATLSLFLESGFLMYALGQNTLLETLRSFQEERRVRGLRTSA